MEGSLKESESALFFFLVRALGTCVRFCACRLEIASARTGGEPSGDHRAQRCTAGCRGGAQIIGHRQRRLK